MAAKKQTMFVEDQGVKFYFIRNKVTGLISNVNEEQYYHRIGTQGKDIQIISYKKDGWGKRKPVRTDNFNWKGDNDYEAVSKEEYDEQQEYLAKQRGLLEEQEVVSG